MSKCKACAHPRRDELDRAFAGDSALRAIAREFALSKDSVRRHRAHIAPAPDPLRAVIEPCVIHPDTPFHFADGRWVCGGCNSWDGSLAYWRLPTAPIAQPDGAGADDASHDEGIRNGGFQGPRDATP
jgi:hypothetical protein